MILELVLISGLVIVSGIGLGYAVARTFYKRLQVVTQKYHTLLEEHKILQEQFSSNVLTDLLTGLPGRKIFDDHLALAISQSRRHQLTFSVMFLDLQGFRMVNDALGYDAGDTILKEVSKRLQASVRQVDTVSRFSGDEFVFIFTQIARAETAAYIAKRLLNALAVPFIVDGQTLYLTASIGIAIFPMDGPDGKSLLKNADLALNQAKKQGNNTWQFYQAEMHALSRRELILGSSLHHEAGYQQFNIYYQPRVNLETKKIVCMEAALQWHHPDFGLIAFEEFSRLAEKNNSIVDIYDWLMRNACQDLMKWREHGFFAEAVSVPVSLRQLESTHFLQKVSSILRETGLEPANLIFELTESSLLNRIDLVEKMLHMLKRLGVRIAINNFGAGLLPLQHLRRLPVDIFKIDRALICDIETNPESEAIIKMIIALAQGLQAQVIAEGVDGAGQKERLLSLGCVTLQGELFSAPMLAQDFTYQKICDIPLI